MWYVPDLFDTVLSVPPRSTCKRYHSEEVPPNSWKWIKTVHPLSIKQFTRAWVLSPWVISLVLYARIDPASCHWFADILLWFFPYWFNHHRICDIISPCMSQLLLHNNPNNIITPLTTTIPPNRTWRSVTTFSSFFMSGKHDKVVHTQDIFKGFWYLNLIQIHEPGSYPIDYFLDTNFGHQYPCLRY